MLRFLLGPKPEKYPERIILLVISLFSLLFVLGSIQNIYLSSSERIETSESEEESRASDQGTLSVSRTLLGVSRSFTENARGLGSVFAICLSGALAYRAFIYSRFADLHQKLYSKEIILARRAFDRSKNVKRINLLNPYDSDSSEILREQFKAWDDLYARALEGESSSTEYDLSEYYKILQFVNFLESACSDYYNKIIPYDKFRDRMDSIVVQYYPSLRSFIEHRKNLRKDGYYLKDYMYRHIEFVYEKMKNLYSQKPEDLRY